VACDRRAICLNQGQNLFVLYCAVLYCATDTTSAVGVEYSTGLPYQPTPSEQGMNGIIATVGLRVPVRRLVSGLQVLGSTTSFRMYSPRTMTTGAENLLPERTKRLKVPTATGFFLLLTAYRRMNAALINVGDWRKISTVAIQHFSYHSHWHTVDHRHHVEGWLVD
jgi:hypothetical protein